MTYQKVTNIIASELKEFKPQRVKISLRHLRSLFKQYKLDEIAIENYCCYGDERCCWIDIEGPGHGWLWTIHDQKDMPKILWRYLKGHMAEYMDKLYKRKAFLYTRTDELYKHESSLYTKGDFYPKDKYLIYVIPMRDIARYDIYITFQLVEDKSE